jgi:FkbM family methyltransferase
VMNEMANGMYNLLNMEFDEGDVVLDIGAHIGGVSVLLAKMHPYITVYAYEPAQRNYDLLVQNLEANDVANVIPVNKAVSGINGFIEMMWSPRDTSSSGSCLTDETKDNLENAGWVRETVECVTLESVFAAHGIERCSWLKLDCEGSEYDIIRNPATLDRADRVSLELHIPVSRMDEGAEACRRDFLDALGWPMNCPHVQIASTVWTNDT